MLSEQTNQYIYTCIYGLNRANDRYAESKRGRKCKEEENNRFISIYFFEMDMISELYI